MFRKGEVSLRMKKNQRGSCLQKCNKQALKKYHSVSLMLVSGKTFERLLYHSMFNFFTENNLISLNQSGFKPGDTYLNQVTLALTK